METFKILVKETLEKVIEVEAETVNDAIEKVEEDYNNEEIVLDYSDFTAVEITEYKEE